MDFATAPVAAGSCKLSALFRSRILAGKLAVGNVSV